MTKTEIETMCRSIEGNILVRSRECHDSLAFLPEELFLPFLVGRAQQAALQGDTAALRFLDDAAERFSTMSFGEIAKARAEDLIL